MRIYCGSVATYGPTVYRCFFGDPLRIYCGPVAPHGPTVYMCFFAEPQNPTGPQCISRIDLRARRRSAVDPQTNTCETVVPQDLTGPQSIRKIQRACCRSAICPRRTVYLPFPVCSPDAQASRCDTATSETTATICRPDSTNQRAALVGPQIRTAFCRNPLKPTTNAAFRQIIVWCKETKFCFGDNLLQKW